MKIVSVNDKRVAALVADPSKTSVKGFSPREVATIQAMLDAIRQMTNPGELASVAAWRAHPLPKTHPGHWSLRVTPNYRLVFKVDQAKQEVSLLDYLDYH